MNEVRYMGREIRMDNRLSNFGIRNLSLIEQNLWWSISRLIKDKGTQELTFTRKQIDKISGYDERSLRSNDFVKNMKDMGRKIVSINTGLYFLFFLLLKCQKMKLFFKFLNILNLGLMTFKRVLRELTYQCL